jgi:hypothetical protein
VNAAKPPTRTAIPRQRTAPNTPPLAAEPQVTAPPAAARPRLLALAIGLPLAWLLAFALHALRVDWLTLSALVLGTAALLRSGPYLLDRLLLSLATLAGVGCAVVLVLPPWHWRLHPVFLGGLGLTVLVLIAAGLGRRPRLPRPRRADWLALLPTAVITLGVAAPMLRRSLADRLAPIIAVEDPARHFAIYDTIRRLGGYPFQHPHEASVSVIHQDLIYPAGAHAVAAVLDNFVTSSATVGDPLHALNRYLWYVVASYAFFALAVLWSARRVAGPSATAWSFAPIAGACVAYLLFSEMITTFMYGYAPQAVGTGYLMILIGVLARPLRRTREQVVVAIALIVAIAYTYYILLPFAAAAALPYVIASRHRLRRHWRFTAIVTLVGAVLSGLPRVLASGDYPLDLLVGTFGIIRVHRSTVLTLGLLVLAGVGVARGWWRSPAMRATGATTAATALFAVAIAAAQLHAIGRTAYFFEKTLYVLIPVLLVALGGVAPAIARLRPTRRLTAAVTALALSAIPLAGYDAFELHTSTAIKEATYGRGYVVGAFGHSPTARLAVQAYQALGNDGPPRPMLFHTGVQFQGLSAMWASGLQRDQGLTWDVYLWSLYQWKKGDAAQLQQYLLDHPTPGLQLVASDPAFLDAMRRFAAAHPEIALTIVSA